MSTGCLRILRFRYQSGAFSNNCVRCWNDSADWHVAIEGVERLEWHRCIPSLLIARIVVNQLSLHDARYEKTDAKTDDPARSIASDGRADRRP